jgi:osmoprotectant transport system ATP-binding protein
VIRLESVRKVYPNGTIAVRDLSLDVADGEVTMLVGPSGCGKTTILRMINRMVEATSGRILLDGDDIARIDPVQLRRHIGYVIQQIGLFPHQTIAHNVGTVPRLLGWDRVRTKARVDEMLDLVGLDPGEFRDRYPGELSGGQRQRVGVARALAADPPVLLMDEPFGAIDPVTRSRLQDEFHRVQSELRKTVVFVTHDIDEAVKLGDRIAILDVGAQLEQYDTPATILGEPATSFVVGFVGGDRALKRLRVTPTDISTLERPRALAPEDRLATARQLLATTGAISIPVVDANGTLRGRIRAQDVTDGADGDVASRTVRVESWTDASDSLQTALSRALLTTDGWIAVLDGETFLGTLTPETVHQQLLASMHSRKTESSSSQKSPSERV